MWFFLSKVIHIWDLQSDINKMAKWETPDCVPAIRSKIRQQ